MMRSGIIEVHKQARFGAFLLVVLSRIRSNEKSPIGVTVMCVTEIKANDVFLGKQNWFLMICKSSLSVQEVCISTNALYLNKFENISMLTCGSFETFIAKEKHFF